MIYCTDNMSYKFSFLCIGALLFISKINLSEEAKILAVFPFHAKSHAILGTVLLKELAKRGHEVTMISLHPLKEPVPNYTDIVLKTSMQDFLDYKENETLYNVRDKGIFEMLNTMFYINQVVCDLQLQQDEIQKLIHSTDLYFDVIIVEAFFNECFLGLSHKFKAPIVQLCTFVGTPTMGEWVGNPNFYSYVPDAFLTFSDKMNFWQRMINTVMGTLWKVMRTYVYLPGQDTIMKKHFGHLADLPSLYELERSTSLLLVNHHFSISYPKPLVPNLIQVGGIHVAPPKKLPQDLQKYLDDAKEGVIYFSMGSNLKGSEMPESKRSAFLEAFSKLKQKVLWKWETDSLPGQPKNVKLSKWLPQTDILAHPNVRLFMTHGGLLSTQEAANRGIPVVGIPVFGDQELNMAWAETAGIGVKLDFDNITTDSVSWAVNEILQNPRYLDKAQELSRIFRDQPLTPLDTAVFWTEYIIRHKGACHMRSAALDLAWYQYFLLDVIAALAIPALIVLYITFKMLRAIKRKVFKSGQKKNIDKSRKKRD